MKWETLQRIPLESWFTNSTKPLPTATCTLQTTYCRQQQDRQTIDKPTILLTVDQQTFYKQKTDRNAAIRFNSPRSQ